MKHLKQYHLVYKLGEKWHKIHSAPYAVLVTMRENLLMSGTYKPHHTLTITHGDLNNFVWSGSKEH